MQGLFLFGLYLLSSIAALILAFILNKTMSNPQKGIEAAEEWPPYRLPSFKSVAGQALNQSSVFSKEARTMILIISLVSAPFFYGASNT